MPIGLASKLNILKQSPFDFEPLEDGHSSQSDAVKWIPSRYNIRSATDDGRLVIWNSYSGTLSVFEAHQRSKIESMLSKKGFTARLEGVVSYLYQRGYLVKEGTDEYR